MEKSDVRFFTYGTHPSVPCSRWGVREFNLLGMGPLICFSSKYSYVSGGIVTFTPLAILEGHAAIFQLIKDIDSHPFWHCYVLPCVVAMVAHLTCQGLNPLAEYDQ